jgi:hypothetical protein
VNKLPEVSKHIYITGAGTFIIISRSRRRSRSRSWSRNYREPGEGGAAPFWCE